MILKQLKSIWTSLKRNSISECTGLCNQGRNCTCIISFTPAMIEVHSLSNKVPPDMRMELLQIEQRIAQLGNEYYERRNNDISETQH
jgi:hypothetical protein